LVDSATIQETIEFAQSILNSDAGEKYIKTIAKEELININHGFNYFNKTISRPHFKERTESDEKKEHIIYTAPGQAMALELRLGLSDPRAGNYPQHNSPGFFKRQLEVIPSLLLDDYKNIHTVICLQEAGYVLKVAKLTKKHLEKVAHQFANLSQRCFRDMMCLYQEDMRDFTAWIKIPQDHQEWIELKGKQLPINCDINVAYINPRLQLIQYMQTMQYNDQGKIIDMKHIVFEAGLPLVINQSKFDCYGNLRNIAHVGMTGSNSNSFQNSLERFDDGTVIWTSSDFRGGQVLTGSAALKESGEVILIEGGDHTMAEFSARNLGAEGINPKTLAWTDKYSADACIAEKDDKFIVRREYKQAVRKQVNQIVDGACIPGPEPIFDLMRLL
jgi:hypothetical protein